MVDKHPRESAVAIQRDETEALTSIHRQVDSIPGNDDGEGLLVLSAGRMRKVIRCDGLNSRSFDASTLQNIATVFSELIAVLDVEIQVVFSNADVREPDFLARYHNLVSTDSDYIHWLSERLEQWFKQIYDSHQVHRSQQHLYLVVTFVRPLGQSVQQRWNGAEIHLPAGSMEACEQQTTRICEGLSQCGFQPSTLNRRELRMLLAEHRTLYEPTPKLQSARPNYPPGAATVTIETAAKATAAATAATTTDTTTAISANPPTTVPTTVSATIPVTTPTINPAINSTIPNLPKNASAFAGTICGTTDGMLFGFNTDSGEPVLFNPFFRGAGKYNNNFLIAAAPSLQSIATMVLILRLLPFGVRFILLSDSVSRFSSYQFLAELLGPEDCVKISLEDSASDILNPFDLSGSEFHGRPSGEKIRSLLSFFDLLLAPEGKAELTIQEKALLNRLIIRVYEEALTQATVPTMSAFASLIEQTAAEEPDSVKRNLLENLACGLSIFTKSGAYSSFLDGHTNIDLNKKLLICETKNINGLRYQKAIAYTLNQFIEKEALRGKTIGKRFALLVHPSTGLMMSDPGLKMLENFSCGARQHAMMFGVITDQMKTLCSKTSSLVKNAHTKIFLPQESDELSALKSELKLTNEQIQSISSFSLIDGSLKCCLNVGDTSGIAALTLSPLEHWICTEEPVKDIPARMSKIKDFKTKYQDLKHAEALRLAVHSLSIESPP